MLIEKITSGSHEAGWEEHCRELIETSHVSVEEYVSTVEDTDYSAWEMDDTGCYLSGEDENISYTEYTPTQEEIDILRRNM